MMIAGWFFSFYLVAGFADQSPMIHGTYHRFGPYGSERMCESQRLVLANQMGRDRASVYVLAGCRWQNVQPRHG